jgi:hypothetical protein
VTATSRAPQPVVQSYVPVTGARTRVTTQVAHPRGERQRRYGAADRRAALDRAVAAVAGQGRGQSRIAEQGLIVRDARQP